jgi:hypothetical protein
MNKHMIWHGYRKVDWENTIIMSADGELWANVPLYLDEVNHSPTGFEWGYSGSGPAQLSYAILRTYFEIACGYTERFAKMKAERLYFTFKEDFVSKWSANEWAIDSEDIAIWLTKYNEKRILKGESVP